MPALSADAALERLREGNRRFSSGEPTHKQKLVYSRHSEHDQEPFAIILGCSDSRVPTEIVFDQGPGDLFVIRVAGNIAAPSQIGSVEFATSQFGTRLVVVLGHTRCGAILATLEALRRPGRDPSRNLCSIVDRIRPSVEGLLESEPQRDLESLVQEGVRANVGVAVDGLRNGSAVLRQQIRDDGLIIMGAEYSLESGVVEFLDCA
jgi:carbonic anhydrase